MEDVKITFAGIRIVLDETVARDEMVLKRAREEAAKAVDDAILNVCYGSPARRRLAEAEFRDSVYPPRRPKWPGGWGLFSTLDIS